MTSERLSQIQSLFDAALSRSAEERDAFLREACADDPELYAQVNALLASDRTGFPLMDAPLVALGQLAPVPDVTPPAPPARVGPYRIVREVGHGGMGTVYLAERDDGTFEQQVALKLTRRGMDSAQIQRRFLYERQILARLAHPNIARLLDGGVSEEGRPYFAMEFVVGTPLNEYADAHHLSIQERLQLFTDVCRAVQYAHQNLIVHRDLKPSNMLVTEAGVTREPVVKLLDFGIAKVLTPDAGADAVLTQTGVQIMTPAYAAPEQVNEEAITTATDIYTLGVVLYELLTGQRPRPAKEGAVTDPPSTVVGKTKADLAPLSPEEVRPARRVNADRLQQALKGDLDWIVMKALRWEPERRYVSAEAFLADLLRYRNGLPVHARPDTFGYRFRKFVGRHRVGVVASALIAVSLIAVAVVSALSAVRVQRALDVARQETAKANEVKNFLVDVFEGADPDVTRGDTLTAPALLKYGTERIEQELTNQPAVRAEVMTMLAEIYQKLGQYDDAEPLLNGALEIQRGLHGDAHPAVAAGMDELGKLAWNKGAYAAAEQRHREALALHRRLPDTTPAAQAQSLMGLAATLADQGRHEEAEPLLREALALYAQVQAGPDKQVASIMHNLGSVLGRQNKLEAAAHMLREALAMRRTLHGNVHREVANTLNSLGTLLGRGLGDLEQAEPLFQEALAIRRQIYGEAHPEIAGTLNNLGSLLRTKGDLDGAESYYREVLPMAQRFMGPMHPNVGLVSENLGNVLYQKGSLAEARSFLQDALRIYQGALPPDHFAIHEAMVVLGRVHIDMNQPALAEPVLRQSLNIRTAKFGTGDARTAEAQAWLGISLLDRRRFAEAESLLTNAYTVLKNAENPDEQRLATIRQRLAALYAAQGETAKAEALAR